MNKEKLMALLETPRARQVEVDPRTKLVATDEDAIGLRVGGRTQQLTAPALGSLFANIRFPESLLKSVPLALSLPVANHLLQKKESLFVVRTEGRIQEVMPQPTHPIMEPKRVVATVERYTGRDASEFTLEVDSKNHEHVLGVVGVDTMPVERVPRGHTRATDLVKAGVQVKFNPYGLTFPGVQAMVQCMWCLNLATDEAVIWPEKGYRGRRGEGDDIWQDFRRNIKAAYGSLEPVIQKYNEMSREALPPGSLSDFVTHFIREARMDERTADAFRARVMDIGADTMFDLYNHLTAVATHDTEDAVVARRVRNLAGIVASERQRTGQCPVCHRHRLIHTEQEGPGIN